MIMFFANLLMGMKPGLAVKTAKRFVWAGLALLLVLALVLTVWLIRRDAVQDHEAERTTDALQSERRATANDKPREAAREAASEETAEELETINEEDPETAVRPASRGDRAVADRLRRD